MAAKIRSRTEPGRYVDGDGLLLELNGKASGRGHLRIQSNGTRRNIGLGSLKAPSLADARKAASASAEKLRKASVQSPKRPLRL